MKLLYDDTWKQVPCKLFVGKLNKGYGQCTARKYGTNKAHKIAYIDYYGSLPTDIIKPCILHKCDISNCIEPLHLFVGTHSDNMADMVSKGRAPNRHGSSNPNAKLSWKKVLAIRASSKSKLELAEEYDVTLVTINHILHNKTWKEQ